MIKETCVEFIKSKDPKRLLWWFI